MFADGQYNEPMISCVKTAKSFARMAMLFGAIAAAVLFSHMNVLGASEAHADTSLQPGSTAMAAAASPGTLEVYAGDDRYDTARRIAEAESGLAGASCSGVIVCSCNEGKFPDALSAAGLSGVLGYPVLTVNGTSLTVYDRTALAAMKASCPTGSLDILIAGDSATVSSAVETSLGAFGKVSKRFNGANRYETNRMIYEYGVSHGGWNTSYTFLTRGDNFPDALTIAPYLAWAKCPIALVDPASSTVPATAKNAVANASEVVALGDKASVSDALLAAARQTSAGKSSARLGGADRYATSALIVKWEFERGMKLQGAGIATGEKFPDALSSSYLLSSESSVLMLVSPSGSNSSMMSIVKSAATSSVPSLMRVFGSTASVPSSVYSQLSSAAGWSSYNTSAKGDAMQSKAAFIKSASQYSQIIMVEATGATATVSLHEKNGAGKWSQLMAASGYVGRGGIGQASEERPVTPAGSFDIPFAFGNASNPGTSLPWHDTTWNSTWVDENGPYYNTWQESGSYSGEHLKSIGWVYDYALVIGYNYPRYRTVRDGRTVSGGGSAFFVHCSEGKPTAGCVSIPSSDMRRLVQLTRAGCRIIIGTPDTVYQY